MDAHISASLDNLEVLPAALSWATSTTSWRSCETSCVKISHKTSRICISSWISTTKATHMRANPYPPQSHLTVLSFWCRPCPVPAQPITSIIFTRHPTTKQPFRRARVLPTLILHKCGDCRTAHWFRGGAAVVDEKNQRGPVGRIYPMLTQGWCGGQIEGTVLGNVGWGLQG